MCVKVLFLHIALQHAVTDKQQTEFTNNSIMININDDEE